MVITLIIIQKILEVNQLLKVLAIYFKIYSARTLSHLHNDSQKCRHCHSIFTILWQLSTNKLVRNLRRLYEDFAFVEFVGKLSALHHPLFFTVETSKFTCPAKQTNHGNTCLTNPAVSQSTQSHSNMDLLQPEAFLTHGPTMNATVLAAPRETVPP